MSPEDWERVSAYHWAVSPLGTRRPYGYRYQRRGRRRRYEMLLHDFVLAEEGAYARPRDGNLLNCTRPNLLAYAGSVPDMGYYLGVHRDPMSEGYATRVSPRRARVRAGRVAPVRGRCVSLQRGVRGPVRAA